MFIYIFTSFQERFETAKDSYAIPAESTSGMPYFKSYYTCHLGDKVSSIISLMSWLKCTYQTIYFIMPLGPVVRGFCTEW